MPELGINLISIRRLPENIKFEFFRTNIRIIRNK